MAYVPIQPLSIFDYVGLRSQEDVSAAAEAAQYMKLAGDVVDMSSYFQGMQMMRKEVLKTDPYYFAKDKTDAVLNRSLGGTRQILQMTPKNE